MDKHYYWFAMRPLAIALLIGLAVPALAVTDSMTIYEADGITQTGTVISFGRPFVQGEFGSGTCPRPVVGGTPIADGSWQFDLKNSWTSDSSIKFGIVSFVAPTFAANGSLAVTFQSGTCNNSGMTQAQMVNFNSGIWGASIEVTAGTTPVTMVSNAKTMLNALTFTDCKLQHWLQGPVVDQVVVQDCTASTAYDFGWSYDGSTMTYSVIGTSNTASLHPNFALSFFPSTGTVKVDFGIENMRSDRIQDQFYKFTLKASSPLAQVYTSVGQAYADSSGNFRQIGSTRWVKTFYSGFSLGNIRIDHNFPYLISTKYYANYDVVIASVNPNSVYGAGSQTGFCAGQNISDYQCFINGDKGDITGSAMIQMSMNTGNDKGAPLRREDLEYLYNMGTCGTANGLCSEAIYILTGQHGLSDTALAANVPGGGGMYRAMLNWPIHQREGRTGGSFYCPGYADINATLSSACGAGVGTTTGHGISRHRDPIGGQMAYGSILAPVGSFTVAPWSLEGNCDHWADWGYSNYLNTGAYWEMEEVQQGANYCAFAENPDIGWAGYGDSFFVYFTWGPGARGMSWPLDQIMKAALVSLDGTAEKTYYSAIIDSNMEIMEGSQGIIGTPLTPTTTNYNCTGYPPRTSTPSTANRWTFGHCGRNTGQFPTHHEPASGGCWAQDIYTNQFPILSMTSSDPSTVNISTTGGWPPDINILNNLTGAIWGGTGAWAAVQTTGPVITNTPTYGVTFSTVTDSTLTVPCPGCVGKAQPITGSLRLGGELGDYSKSTDFSEIWMTWGLGVVVNRLIETGFTNATAFNNELNKYLTTSVLDSGFNPYLVALYAMPIKNGFPCADINVGQSTSPFLSTWADVKAAVIPPIQSVQTFDWIAPCGNAHAYTILARANGSFITNTTGDCTQGACQGSDAWTWLNAHVPYYTQSVAGSTPCIPGNDYPVIFSFSPRSQSSQQSSTSQSMKGASQFKGGLKFQ